MLENNSLYLPLLNFARPNSNRDSAFIDKLGVTRGMKKGYMKYYGKRGILQVSWYLYPSLTEDICYTYKFKNREVAWERKIKRACSFPYYYIGEKG